MQNILKLLIAIGLVFGTTLEARAVPINGADNPSALPTGTDAPIAVNQWYSFGFGGVGSSFVNGSCCGLGVNPTSIAAPDPAWTFTLPSGGELIVVDGFDSGDQFNITDSGASLGNTSTPISGVFCNNDITACLNNPAMSKGSFSLGAGAHAIDGTAIASPFGAGGAFFEVVPTSTSVPEPASLALFGTSLLGFLIARRRKVA